MIPAPMLAKVEDLKKKILSGEIKVWNVVDQGYPDYLQVTEPAGVRGSHRRPPTHADGSARWSPTTASISSVAPGTIHAVVGGNGAGKSTLMRILQGVDRPDEGSVILNDAPVRLTGPADAFARGIGMVHQEFMLAPPLTLLENLILAHEPARPRRPDRLARGASGG